MSQERTFMLLKINMQSEWALQLPDKSHAKETSVLVLSSRHKLEWLGGVSVGDCLDKAGLRACLGVKCLP